MWSRIEEAAAKLNDAMRLTCVQLRAFLITSRVTIGKWGEERNVVWQQEARHDGHDLQALPLIQRYRVMFIRRLSFGSCSLSLPSSPCGDLTVDCTNTKERGILSFLDFGCWESEGIKERTTEALGIAHEWLIRKEMGEGGECATANILLSLAASPCTNTRMKFPVTTSPPLVLPLCKRPLPLYLSNLLETLSHMITDSMPQRNQGNGFNWQAAVSISTRLVVVVVCLSLSLSLSLSVCCRVWSLIVVKDRFFLPCHALAGSL